MMDQHYPTWKGRVMDADEDNLLAIVNAQLPLGPAALIGTRGGVPTEIPVEAIDSDPVDGALVRLPNVLALLLFQCERVEAR